MKQSIDLILMFDAGMSFAAGLRLDPKTVGSESHLPQMALKRIVSTGVF